MRRLIIPSLLFIASSNAFATVPYFHHNKPEDQQEFELIYSKIDRVSNQLNPLNVSSGTITNLNVTTVTWGNGYKQYSNAIVNVLDKGVKGNGTDETGLIQAALDGLISGQTLYFPATASSYLWTSQLLIQNVNRITIAGDTFGTVFNYTPTAVNTRAFAVDGSVDNVTFKDFYIGQSAPTTWTGTSAFVVGTGATKIKWRNVKVAGFSRYGINLGGGTYYITIEDCRFTKVQDTTNTFNAIAIYSSGSNSFAVRDTQFSENDKVIQIDSGAKVDFIRNEAEGDGDSGNTLIDYTMQFTGVTNLNFSNNYVEGEKQLPGYAVVRLNNCVNAHISQNNFSGENGPTPETVTVAQVLNSTNTIFQQNEFIDPTSYFIDNNCPVQLVSNTFSHGHVYFSSHSAVMQWVSDPTKVDLDKIVYSGWDPVNLIPTAGETSPNFSVTGSSVNDTVEVYPPGNIATGGLQGLTYSGYVNTNGTAVVRIQNGTGGAIDLSSGTWGVRIRKPQFN